MKQSTISWLTMTPWITVHDSGLLIMDWKTARLRVCHWLYALHSCQTIITIILLLFSILLTIKPFSPHLFSLPYIFACTILSDFQLFEHHQFLQFSSSPKIWFMILPILVVSNSCLLNAWVIFYHWYLDRSQEHSPRLFLGAVVLSCY